MSDLQDAVNLLKGQAKNARAIMAVGEVLDRMVSLEQGEREAVARTADAKAKAAEAVAQMDQASADLLAVQQKAREMMDAASAIAEKTTSQAQAAAKIVRDDASAKADSFVSAAMKQKAGIDAQASQARADLAALVKELGEKSQMLASVKAESAKLAQNLR